MVTVWYSPKTPNESTRILAEGKSSSWKAGRRQNTIVACLPFSRTVNYLARRDRFADCNELTNWNTLLGAGAEISIVSVQVRGILSPDVEKDTQIS